MFSPVTNYTIKFKIQMNINMPIMNYKLVNLRIGNIIE